MTDRRKSRQHRTLQRREITTVKEKEEVARELREDAIRVIAAKAGEKTNLNLVKELVESKAHESRENEEGWTPPRGYAAFFAMVEEAHPDWPWGAKDWQTNKLLQRQPFIEKAFLAGLAIGNQLRAQAQYGRGHWWKELEDLTPEERGVVLDRVKAVVCKRT